MKLKNKKYSKQIKNLISKKLDVSFFKLYEFKEGWAVIVDKKTSNYGWISEDYKKIIKPIYDLCYKFEEGCAIFQKDNKEGWIDSSGKILRRNTYYILYI